VKPVQNSHAILFRVVLVVLVVPVGNLVHDPRHEEDPEHDGDNLDGVHSAKFPFERVGDVTRE
jgi:hypothetical protein